MDEDEFRAAMGRVAAPQAVTLRAVDAIQRRATAKRRQRKVTIGVVVGATVLVAVGLVTTQINGASRSTPPPSSPTPSVHVTEYTDAWGIRLGMETRFADDRDVISASLQAGTNSAKVTVYPQDGTDYDAGPPVPLPLPAGTSVSAEGTVMPNCRDDITSPVLFVVESRLADGTLVTDRFAASNPEVFGPALDKWCARDPYVLAAGGSLTPDGDAAADVTIINPGPNSIHVEIPRFSDGGASWSAASTTVPPGERVMMVVKGTHVRLGGDQEAPWEHGRLLIDGEPFTFPYRESWLG